MARPKKLRQKNGLGYLYKRDVHGKEHPANSKVPGIFWLATTTADGKRIRQRLEIDGQPITDLEAARAEQMRVRVPYITHTQLDAVRTELARLETKLEKEIDEADQPLKIADAWNAFEIAPNRPECAYETMKSHRSMFDSLVAWCKAEHADQIVFVRDLTAEVLAGYLANISAQHVSANTYNKYVGFFKMFFRVLAKPARLTSNPLQDVKKRRLHTKSRRILTMNELRTVLLDSTGEMQRLFFIGTFTGLRLGDCCTLKWNEVSLLNGVIRRIPRKTHASGNIVIIGIPPVLGQMLSEIKIESEYVCPTYAKRYLQSRNEQSNITREIQAFFEKCGIQTKLPPDGTRKRAVLLVGFHSLRHTYATIHAEKETPQSVIQDNLGHKNSAMTEHYQHISEATARKFAAALQIPELCTENDLRADLIQKIQQASEDDLKALLKAWEEIKRSSANDFVHDDREDSRQD